MQRSQQKALLSLIAVLGFAAMATVGFFYRGASIAQKVDAQGWCCTHQGSACTLAESVNTCESAGGSLFDKSARICNSLCQ
jgi:hypothetical protein